MTVGVCVACRGLAEAPFTFVDDARGRPTRQVVCRACLTAAVPDDIGDDDWADRPADLGGEGG